MREGRSTGKGTGMYDIFISHSSTDKPWVRELAKRIDAERFQGRSLRSWFDEQELSVGDKLRPELEAAIEESRYIGIVLSKAALASKWVRFEWDHWLTRDANLERVLPILLEDCEIPIKYKELIQADFRKQENFAAGFTKLLDKLRQYGGPDAREVGDRAVRLLVEAEANRERCCACRLPRKSQYRRSYGRRPHSFCIRSVARSFIEHGERVRPDAHRGRVSCGVTATFASLRSAAADLAEAATLGSALGRSARQLEDRRNRARCR